MAIHGVSKVLTEEVRELALHEGARLVGVASVDRFAGAPRGHHPAEMVKNARAVVTFAIPQIEQVADWEELFLDSEVLPEAIRKPMLQDYLYAEVNYNFINDRLDQVAHRLAVFLQDRGFRSLLFPATFGPAHKAFHDMMPGWMGLFSQRHAAVRAGLGEFALNNVVITREYGPRVRFNSVITQAPLAASPLLSEKICLGTACNLCIEKCGGDCLTVPPGFDEKAVWLDPISRTDMPACRKWRREVFCYGRCLQVCPIGKLTSPAGPNS